MSLCALCNTIDLSILNNHALLRSHEHGIRLGSFHPVEQWSAGNCPLCRLVKALSLSYPVKDSSPFELFARIAWKSDGALPNPKPIRTLRRAAIATFEDDIHISILALEANSVPWNSFRNPYIALFPQDFAKKETYLPVVNPTLDFKTIRKWITKCVTDHTSERFHSQLRGLEPWKTSDTYRFIDCEKREVVRGRPSCVYIALSYVWGPKPFNEDVVQKGRVVAKKGELAGGSQDCILYKNIPNVVEDAMNVVSKLGLRFLWVDRYCIDQNDAEDKRLQLAQMDKVYQNAYVTLIAGAGQGPDHGLPGMRDRRLGTRVETKIGNHTAHVIPAHPVANLLQSKWNSRGWVYQEGILSQRRLIFTEEEVFFHCDSMDCREITNLPSWQQPLDIGIFPPLNQTEDSLLRHIEEYSGRKLSYQYDILNGIEAIFRAFEVHTKIVPPSKSKGPRKEPGGNQRLKTSVKLPRQFWGVPFIETDLYGISAGASLGPPRFASSSLVSLTAKFLLGLDWSLAPTRSVPIRREGFPSWSWAGWIARVEFPGKEKRWLSTWTADPEFVLHPVLREKDNSSRTWVKGGFQDLIVSRPNLHLCAPNLQIDVWTINMKFEPNTDELTAQSLALRKQNKYLPYLDLDVDVSVDKMMAASIVGKTWLCIVIGYTHQAFQKIAFPVALVCEWDGWNAKRIGIVRLVDWEWEFRNRRFAYRAALDGKLLKIRRNGINLW